MMYMYACMLVTIFYELLYKPSLSPLPTEITWLQVSAMSFLESMLICDRLMSNFKSNALRYLHIFIIKNGSLFELVLEFKHCADV